MNNKIGWGLISYAAFILSNVYFFRHWIGPFEYVVGMSVAIYTLIHYKCS